MAGTEITPAESGSQIKRREERKCSLEEQIAELSQVKPLEPKDIAQRVEKIRSPLNNIKVLLDQSGDQSRKALRDFFCGIADLLPIDQKNGKKDYYLILPFSFKEFYFIPNHPKIGVPTVMNSGTGQSHSQ